jgi:hypothetical protein
MHPQKPERLRRKLSENAQRRAREAYLDKLPAGLRDYLAPCRTRHREELFAFFGEQDLLSGEALLVFGERGLCRGESLSSAGLTRRSRMRRRAPMCTTR